MPAASWPRCWIASKPARTSCSTSDRGGPKIEMKPHIGAASLAPAPAPAHRRRACRAVATVAAGDRNAMLLGAMAELCNLDGAIVPVAAATVPVLDRGFL